MTLRLAIVGLPQSGKTTVFNALTHSQAPTGGFSSAGDEPNIATVKVSDPRVDGLVRMVGVKRSVYASIQYLDVAGLAKGLASQGLGGRLLGYLLEADALILVVRAFEDDNVPHPEGPVDALRDLETLVLEIMISDLGIIERRLSRIDSMIPKLRGEEREEHQRERMVLRRCVDALENDVPLRQLVFDSDEERMMRGFGFLSLKPILALLNVGEAQIGKPQQALIELAQERFASPGVTVEALAGLIEMEIGELDPPDAQLFMADLGIMESGLNRAIQLSYELLNLITFLTFNPQEARAWAVPAGTTAVEAAGEIHTDIARGFIRGEIVSYEDLLASGGMKEAREAGLLRVEGRDYVMRDGDVAHFLFNV